MTFDPASSDSSTIASPLSYQAKRGMPGRRVRVNRTIAHLAIAAALLAVSFTIYQRGYVQRYFIARRLAECAAYVAPPGQIVYEEHNGPAANQWSGESLRALPHADRWKTRRSASAPPCLQGLGNYFQPPHHPLFLGRLRAPDGQEQTVLLAIPHISIAPPSPPLPFEKAPAATRVLRNVFTQAHVRSYLAVREHASTTVIDPLGQGRFGSDTIAVFSFWDQVPNTLDYRWDFHNKAEVFRFYAAQRDPTDPSRFAFDFDADDKRVRVHCRLVSGSRLRMELETLTPDPDDSSADEIPLIRVETDAHR